MLKDPVAFPVVVVMTFAPVSTETETITIVLASSITLKYTVGSICKISDNEHHSE